MQKRGLSVIVTSVLIILFAIATIAILAFVIQRSSKESLSDNGLNQYTAQFNIPLSSVFVDENSKTIDFDIERKAGQGDLYGFRIILTNDQGSSETNRSYENISVRELESIRVHITYLLSGRINSIEVAPVLKSINGERVLGQPVDRVFVGANGRASGSRNSGGGSKQNNPTNNQSNNSSNQTYLCNNGIDDDGDGRTDLLDRGCTDASDNSELDPEFCGYMWNVVGSTSGQIDITGFPSLQNSGYFKVGLLNQGDFGTYPYYEDNGVEHNGGIPQRVNITRHLEIAQRILETNYPDPNWTGYMVIDYESWFPSWDWNMVWQNYKYINESVNYYVSRHNTNEMNSSQIDMAARAEFDAAAKELWNQTISMGKRVRPKAVWGYYGYPITPIYLAATPVCPGSGGIGMNDCRRGLNNDLDWLTQASDVILPEIYQQNFVNESMPANVWWSGQIRPNENKQIIETRVNEALRVANRFGRKPVIPYIANTYISSDPSNPFNSQLIYNPNNINDSYYYPIILGVDGMIIWGSSSAGSNPNAQQFSQYVANFTGPITTYGNRMYCGYSGGPSLAACMDEIDNDGDGKTDLFDLQCSSAVDNDELA